MPELGHQDGNEQDRSPSEYIEEFLRPLMPVVVTQYCSTDPEQRVNANGDIADAKMHIEPSRRRQAFVEQVHNDLSPGCARAEPDTCNNNVRCKKRHQPSDATPAGVAGNLAKIKATIMMRPVGTRWV